MARGALEGQDDIFSFLDRQGEGSDEPPRAEWEPDDPAAPICRLNGEAFTAAMRHALARGLDAAWGLCEIAGEDPGQWGPDSFDGARCRALEALGWDGEDLMRAAVESALGPERRTGRRRSPDAVPRRASELWLRAQGLGRREVAERLNTRISVIDNDLHDLRERDVWVTEWPRQRGAGR